MDRIYHINNLNYISGNICYIMSRDQRVNNNWALQFALEQAERNKTGVCVIFALQDEFLNASSDIFNLMLSGLKDTKQQLAKLKLPFYLLKGRHSEIIPQFVKDFSIGMLVGDFDPLKIKRSWQKEINSAINIPFIEIDAHNIVPARIASPKLEYAAYTIRTKIKKVLYQYLFELPKYPELRENIMENINISDFSYIHNKLLEKDLKHKYDIILTEKEAENTLQEFIQNRLNQYDKYRNYPNINAVSELSPYLHFGKISAQKAAFDIFYSEAEQVNKDKFLEELIIRRELSDNFCLYNENYDNFDGFNLWAKDTLNKHRDDPREPLYELEVLENSASHDPLWNAANNQMKQTGKMHGYLRMYWAKKILHWAATPELAIEYAIYLNDKYSIDGRDPNGYAGIAWAIGGTHDRVWFERTIFGKVRYMSYESQIKKYDYREYLKKYSKDMKTI